VRVGFLCPTIFHVGYDVLYDGKAYCFVGYDVMHDGKASCRARIVVMKKAVEHSIFMTLDTVVKKRLNEIFTIFCPFSLMTVPMLSVIRKFLYNAFYRLLLLSIAQYSIN
jgi:hypothetical protein